MDLSFYGGRQGIPFKIVGSYKSIDEMTTAFANDPEGVEVGYGDYVLINTEEALRNTDNGKLFQRTLNPNNPKYVGRIIGPAGYSPNVYFGDYDELVEEFNPEGTDTIKFSSATSATSEDSKQIILIPGTPTKVSEGEKVSEISAILKSERKFNEENKTEETEVTIGLQIPYHNLNIEARVGEDPYAEEGLISRSEDETESGPFYSKWTLTVPKGVKGDSPRAIYIRKGLRDFEEEKPIYSQGKKLENLEKYDNKNVVVAEICDFTNFTDDAKGTLVYYELLGEQLVSHHALYVYDVLENLQLGEYTTIEEFLNNNDKYKNGPTGDNADFAIINVQSKEGEKITQSNFYAYVNSEWKNIGGFEVNDINFISIDEVTQAINSNALNFIYYESPSDDWIEGRI